MPMGTESMPRQTVTPHNQLALGDMDGEMINNLSRLGNVLNFKDEEMTEEYYRSWYPTSPPFKQTQCRVKLKDETPADRESETTICTPRIHCS